MLKIYTKIKNKYGIVLPSIVLIITLLNFIASLWVSNFIYEPNMINPFYTFCILFFPFTSIIIGIIIILKFIIDYVKKKDGSHLKLTIVIIMVLITILPSFLISKLSIYIIKSNLDLFLSKNMIESISYIMDISNNEIIIKQNYMLNTISKVGIDYFNNIFNHINGDEYIYNSEYFNNIIFLSNNNIFYNSTDYIPIDTNYKLTNDNIAFANNEYNDLFYVSAIIPLYISNNYVIWFEAMPDNYLNIKNEYLDYYRFYDSINMFTNEFSNILNILYLFILGISSFFSILFGTILSKLIITPISSIIDASDSITKSDFNINIKPTGINDMKKLIYKFNVMANALKYHRNRENKKITLEIWREAAIKVSHEIKNPLMPIIMNAELLNKKLSKNILEKDINIMKESTNIIIKNANFISNLTKSFQEFSFSIKLSDNKQSINDVIIEVLNSFKYIENINFYVSLTKYDHLINMDRDKLIIAFNNLIKNAIESIENSENFNIYISSYHELINLNEFFIISITDTGTGIDANNINKIFEPYFTSKGKKGTGIGLATVEKIIIEHGGNIKVESIIGEGSTFFIKFIK